MKKVEEKIELTEEGGSFEGRNPLILGNEKGLLDYALYYIYHIIVTIPLHVVLFIVFLFTILILNVIIVGIIDIIPVNISILESYTPMNKIAVIAIILTYISHAIIFYGSVTRYSDLYLFTSESFVIYSGRNLSMEQENNNQPRYQKEAAVDVEKIDDIRMNGNELEVVSGSDIYPIPLNDKSLLTQIQNKVYCL